MAQEPGFILRLEERHLKMVERMRNGRTRTAMLRRAIEILNEMSLDDIWPEDRELKNTAEKYAPATEGQARR